jgi:mycothiol synthase
MPDQQKPQLQMLWPAGRAAPSPQVPDGYRLRCLAPGEEDEHARLMQAAGFADWRAAALVETWLPRVLPDGLFVIEHLASGRLVATTMATHHPVPGHPFGGELGWVAADPQHAGKGLGLATCAAVTARFLSAGYRRIYLLTDDHRLPAIRTYLKLGWRPLVRDAAIEERWRAVCGRLALACEPIREPA